MQLHPTRREFGLRATRRIAPARGPRGSGRGRFGTRLPFVGSVELQRVAGCRVRGLDEQRRVERTSSVSGRVSFCPPSPDAAGDYVPIEALILVAIGDCQTDRGESSSTSGDECMPSQQGFRCDDTGDFCQEFPTKRLTLYREPTSLVVCETKLPPAKPSFEDFVLLEQVDHSGLLVTLEPTSDGDDQTRSRTGPACS